MAVAHKGHVWEYIAGGPFPDECYLWKLKEKAPRTVEGYVVTNVSPDDSTGFVPYDNRDEIWPIVADSKTAVHEEDELPPEVWTFWW